MGFEGLQAPVWPVQAGLRLGAESQDARSQVPEDCAFHLKSKGEPRSSAAQAGLQKQSSQATEFREHGREAEWEPEDSRGGSVTRRQCFGQGGGSRVREGTWDIPRGRIKGPGGYGNGVNHVTFIKINAYGGEKSICGSGHS